MTDTLRLIASCIFSFFDVFAFYRLHMNKLTYRFSERTRIPMHVLLYIWFLATPPLSRMFTAIPLKLPLILLSCFYIFCMYKDSVYKRILWIAVAYFTLNISEIFTIPLVLALTHTSLANFLLNPTSYFLGHMLSRSLVLILVELLIRSKYAQKRIHDSFTKEFFAVILIDVMYMIIIACLFYYENIFLDVDTAIGLSFVVIILISFVAILLLRKVVKKSEDILTTNLKLQQIELEHKLAGDMTLVVENLRSLRHDMNNHMTVLQGLLSLKEYDEMASYLSSITEELNVANSFYFADNKILSVLLNSKISKANELGITFETDILTSNTPLTDRDLCAVVGNVLENAIEAAAKHAKPYIFFSMQQDDGQFVLLCDNTFAVAPIVQNGNYLTTKEDSSYHGIGIKTIRSIVESYHGTAEFTVDEQFHVQITIPASSGR